MKSFLNDNFLLRNETAKKLFHDYAAKMPIIDYHCHINPAEIADNKTYKSLSEVWLGGDHYKWRLMRAEGVPESKVVKGLENDPYGVFEAFANTMPKAVGSPVYQWTHLELKRYFGIDTPITGSSAKEIYDLCNKKLKSPEMSVRGIISQSNVKLICTTDDPIDSLEYHKQIAEDASCNVKVLPAFRPDRAVHLEKPDFPQYIQALGKASGIEINDFSSLCKALTGRIEFFDKMGCRASDHALDYCVSSFAPAAKIDETFKKAVSGEAVSTLEAEEYYTAVLLHLGREYSRLGWVMQIHFGCMRNNNQRMFEELGPDTGFDAMNGSGKPSQLAAFLNALDAAKQLPKMILYSLNPIDNEVIASVAGCFMADAECPGKIQLGSAWWFNDTKAGMEKQLQDFANNNLLGNFVGMLTDSRSFLSYTRHEYFRRILCNFIGDMVENGEYPADLETLGKLVQDISYNNTVKFFGFDV